MERIPRLIQAVVESAKEAHFDSSYFIDDGDLSRKVDSLLCRPDAKFHHAADQQCVGSLQPMSCFQDKILRSRSELRSCI